jgi:hypothetical protein
MTSVLDARKGSGICIAGRLFVVHPAGGCLFSVHPYWTQKGPDNGGREQESAR